MGQTILQKIIAAHCGKDSVVPGELVNAKVDMAFSGELSGALAIRYMQDMGIKKVFDPSRIALIPDHNTPNKDIRTATNSKIMREFAKETGITHCEVGRMGIEHVIMNEKGLIGTGDLIVGADSHTCTHGALGALSLGVGSTGCLAGVRFGSKHYAKHAV